MRDYSKVSPKFWIGSTGKRLRQAGLPAQVVAMYLLTAPNSNMLGLFYLPLVVVAHETGLTADGARKGLQSCIGAQFCAYDEASEMVWVYEMAGYQIGDQLAAGDKQCKGVQNAYDSLPENPFLAAFYARYRDAFHLTKSRGELPQPPDPKEAPSKPLRSQEQEQEQEIEQEQAIDQTLSTSSTAVIVPHGTLALEAERRTADDIERVFAHWQRVHQHPKATLDKPRRRLIRERLKTYSADDLCQSISGYLNSPHHMGDNDRGTKYDTLDLILRDAKHVDMGLGFIARPMRSGPVTATERIERALRRLESSGGETYDA